MENAVSFVIRAEKIPLRVPNVSHALSSFALDVLKSISKSQFALYQFNTFQ